MQTLPPPPRWSLHQADFQLRAELPQLVRLLLAHLRDAKVDDGPMENDLVEICWS